MKKILACLTASALYLSAGAKVVLPSYFSDNMIVQQKTTLTIPGTSTTGNEVVVKASWDKKKYSAHPDDKGNFEINLPTPKAGGPHTLTIDDGEPLTLTNILSGEVWLCSGQSNMEMPVKGWGKVLNYEQELADGNHPHIRLLQVKRVIAHAPADDIQVEGNGWQECNSKSLEEFSAVAYFYARYLHEHLHVPVGVINSSWGGTPAEAWTGIATLKQVMGLEQQAAAIEQCEADITKLNTLHRSNMEAWQKAYNAVDAGMEGNKPKWADAEQAGSEWKQMELPGGWEYKGLPNFDGAVWFQKVVDIPPHWEGHELELHLGSIDDEDVTYYNGKEIARGGGYWIHRSYKIPAELVKPGKGIITVRVQDNSGGGGIGGNAHDLSIGIGNDKIALAGPWKYRVGSALAQQPAVPHAPTSQNYAGNLYNAMIYPLGKFPIKGAIWYQGESNVDRAVAYTPLFQAMINDWRALWGYSFPFYFVQLANFLDRQEVQPLSTWAHLREAQANALHLENTGMAVAIDIGEAYDIHPKNKQEVGSRLARAALANTYGKGKYAVATCTDFRVIGKTIELTFDQEITIRGEKAEGLVIAGPDMKFHRADAQIKGNRIIVSSPEVSIPIAVRYAWADNPPCNLYGDGGLPVAPFRTDKLR
ncbi:MAG: 9-O-acetylesterase [Coprobacter sp.]|nr:9-O-acetylesterase [Coprobacter sp.]